MSTQLGFEYFFGYANAFPPISSDGSRCIPVTRNFAYDTPRMHTPFPPCFVTAYRDTSIATTIIILSTMSDVDDDDDGVDSLATPPPPSTISAASSAAATNAPSCLRHGAPAVDAADVAFYRRRSSRVRGRGRERGGERSEHGARRLAASDEMTVTAVAACLPQRHHHQRYINVSLGGACVDASIVVITRERERVRELGVGNER